MINYLLKGFGYASLADFLTTTFKMFFLKKWFAWLSLTVAVGSFRAFIGEYIGLDLSVFWAFLLLIGAEFHTGLKVARKIRKERFKSRPFGRMFLKIGIYVFILYVLHAFTKQVKVPDVLGISLNPFTWLYHIIFIGMVFQLFISWMENLGRLGYKETKTLAGFILRKFNKWFEFDGSKDNNDE